MARARTARQRAASRRNIRKAQMVSARKRRGTGKKPLRDVGSVKRSTAKRVAPVGVRKPIQRKGTRKSRVKRVTKVAAGAVVVGGAVAYGYDLHKNVRLYHNTDKRHIKGIKETGLHGVRKGSYSHVNFDERPGDVFFAKGINTTKMFGNHVVKVKMNRKEFNRHALRDRHMPPGMRAYKINERHIRKGTKGVKYRTYPGGLVQRAQYRQMFPDGTKESYNPIPKSPKNRRR